MTLKEELGYGLDALVLFRGLQQNPVIHALMEFCHADSSDLANQIRTYSSIVAALYPATDNLTDYMEKIVLEEETVYVQRIGAGEAVSDAMTPSIICLHWTKPATSFQSVTQTRLT